MWDDLKTWWHNEKITLRLFYQEYRLYVQINAITIGACLALMLYQCLKVAN